MRRVVDKIHEKVSMGELLKRGFFSGIGWAFGATVGFVIISTLLIVVLQRAGGLPLIGGFIASVVQATLDQLVQTSPLFSN